MMRVLPLACATFALAACAHSRPCGAISDTVGRLECGAAAGDKLAQLQLGIRYETGDGVPRNFERAERLYARAAHTRRRPAAVYSPAVGNERYGRLISAGSGRSDPGLPEARRRLEALRQLRRGER